MSTVRKKKGKKDHEFFIFKTTLPVVKFWTAVDVCIYHIFFKNYLQNFSPLYALKINTNIVTANLTK